MTALHAGATAAKTAASSLTSRLAFWRGIELSPLNRRRCCSMQV